MKVIRRQVGTHIDVAAKLAQHGVSDVTDTYQGAWSGVALAVRNKMACVSLAKDGDIALKFSRRESGRWPGVASGPKVRAKVGRRVALQLTMFNNRSLGHCTNIRRCRPMGHPTTGPK